MTREAQIIAMERRLAGRMARGFARLLGRDAATAEAVTAAAKADLAAFLGEERAALGREIAAALPATALRSLRRQLRLLVCLVAFLAAWLAWQTWWFRHELRQRTPTAAQIQWMMQGYARDHEKETP